jgi:hypothetical protein
MTKVMDKNFCNKLSSIIGLNGKQPLPHLVNPMDVLWRMLRSLGSPLAVFEKLI